MIILPLIYNLSHHKYIFLCPLAREISHSISTMTLGLFLRNFGRRNREQGPTEKHGKHISGLVCKNYDKTKETSLKAARLEMTPMCTNDGYTSKKKKLITQSSVDGCSVRRQGMELEFGVISLRRNWV